MLVFNHSLLSLVEYYQRTVGIKMPALRNEQSAFLILHVAVRSYGVIYFLI